MVHVLLTNLSLEVELKKQDPDNVRLLPGDQYNTSTIFVPGGSNFTKWATLPPSVVVSTDQPPTCGLSLVAPLGTYAHATPTNHARMNILPTNVPTVPTRNYYVYLQAVGAVLGRLCPRSKGVNLEVILDKPEDVAIRVPESARGRGG